MGLLTGFVKYLPPPFDYFVGQFRRLLGRCGKKNFLRRLYFLPQIFLFFHTNTLRKRARIIRGFYVAFRGKFIFRF